MAAGLELLARHYPMPASDIEQLEGCAAAFVPLFAGAGTPAFSVAAPQFVGCASMHAIRLLLGNAVAEADFAMLLGTTNLFGPQQLVRLTHLWGQWAARDARVLARS